MEQKPKRNANRNEYHKQWQRDNAEKRKDIVKRSYTKHKAERRVTYVNKKYGISKSEYRFMKLLQQGKCAICGGKSGRGDLDVDHCHSTNKVRGLLCNNCNRGLGHFQDSPEFLASAIEYLESQGKDGKQ